MEFSIETQEMQRIANYLGNTAKPNATDTSSNVLIEATSEGVTFVAINPTTSVTIKSNTATVAEEGTVAVLYSKLKSFVSVFTPWNESFGLKQFDFKSNNNNLTIKVKNINVGGQTSNGKVKLELFPAYTIPKPQDFGSATFVMPSDTLKAAINRVIYAINPNEARKHLRGMYMSFDENNITFVGTDGLKLSEYLIPNISGKTSGGYLINQDFLQGLRRLLPAEEQVFFEIKSGTIKTKFSNIVYNGRLIVGLEFPKYESFLEDFVSTIAVDKDILQNSLRPFMGGLNTNDNSRISVNLDEGSLTYSSDFGSFLCVDDLPSEPKHRVDVNGVFLSQTLDALNDDKLTVNFSASGKYLLLFSDTFKDHRTLLGTITIKEGA